MSTTTARWPRAFLLRPMARWQDKPGEFSATRWEAPRRPVWADSNPSHVVSGGEEVDAETGMRARGTELQRLSALRSRGADWLTQDAAGFAGTGCNELRARRHFVLLEERWEAATRSLRFALGGVRGDHPLTLSLI
jgi:hypothetical protein